MNMEEISEEYATSDLSTLTYTTIKQSTSTGGIDGVAKGLIFIGTIGFIGNSFSAGILLSSKKTRTKYFNMFLINQCLIDTVTCILIIATYANVYSRNNHYEFGGTLYCIFWDGNM